MGDNTAFFYGTLMAPGVLYRVIYGRPNPSPLDHPAMKLLCIRPALLHNHRRHRVIGADYPAILPEEGGTVRGTVVSGLTEGDLWRLDIFEGNQYERQRVRVKVLKDAKLDEATPENENSQANGPQQSQSISATDEEAEAQTYIWIYPASELDPSEWDFDEFKRDKMKAWMGGGSGWDDEQTRESVEVDEGFADVDNAVAELAKDPTGGRGVNGHIGKQLQEMQANKYGESPEWSNGS